MNSVTLRTSAPGGSPVGPSARLLAARGQNGGRGNLRSSLSCFELAPFCLAPTTMIGFVRHCHTQMKTNPDKHRQSTSSQYQSGEYTVRPVGVVHSAPHPDRQVVRGLDAVDGTPVVDIKPHIPSIDARPTARRGWLEGTGAKIDSSCIETKNGVQYSSKQMEPKVGQFPPRPTQAAS